MLGDLTVHCLTSISVFGTWLLVYGYVIYYHGIKLRLEMLYYNRRTHVACMFL